MNKFLEQSLIKIEKAAAEDPYVRDAMWLSLISLIGAALVFSMNT